MTDPLKTPESDWEYALAAADTLVVSHLREASLGGLVRPRQAQVVVAMAAAIYALARAGELDGQRTTQVGLDDLRRRLEEGAGQLIVAAPATAGMGLEQRTALLDDGAARAQAFTLAAEVVTSIITAGHGFVATIEDQVARHHRGQGLRLLEETWELDT